MAISKITKPFRYYKVNTGDGNLIIYKAANIVTIRRISVIIFTNSQAGYLFAIHLFTGAAGNDLTAKWIFNSGSGEVLTPRVEGDDIIIDSNGTSLATAWGTGIAIPTIEGWGEVNTCLLRWLTSGVQHDKHNKETKFSTHFSSRSEYIDRRILYALLWRRCNKQTDGCGGSADVSRLWSRGKTRSNVHRLCRKCVHQGKKLEYLDELEKNVIAPTSSTFDGRCAA